MVKATANKNEEAPVVTKSSKSLKKASKIVTEDAVVVPGIALAEGLTLSEVPEGRPTSGRTWKSKQTSRSSTLHRSGIMSHLNKNFEEKKLAKERLERMKAFERELKEEKMREAAEEKERRAEREKRRQQNEYKNSVYQVINPEKLKGMSKKQLRMIKKTSVNASTGQVELVNPWDKGQALKKISSKKKR